MLAVPEVQEQAKYKVCQMMPKEGLRERVEHLEVFSGPCQGPGVTESQNHRIVGFGRDLCGSSSPTLLLKQGHLQQAAQDLVQAGLEYLQRRRRASVPLPGFGFPRCGAALGPVAAPPSTAPACDQWVGSPCLTSLRWRVPRGQGSAARDDAGVSTCIRRGPLGASVSLVEVN